MKFIDLFSGLGGFHIALSSLGHECVYASEVDKYLQKIYYDNFGVKSGGDIRTVQASDIPKHDILCAGFPCQPYSKAGGQKGRECPKWGDLFEDHVLRIAKHHKPKYVILENVPNLHKHNNGETWRFMKDALKNLGYEVDEKILSPHMFGVPHKRERLFVVGALNGLSGFSWPEAVDDCVPLYELLDQCPEDAKELSTKSKLILDVWQEFLDRMPASVDVPSFPIWSMEFGATYPYKEKTPYSIGGRKLRAYKGSYGFDLSLVRPAERLVNIPSYARTDDDQFPKWKQRFIMQNREFYCANKKWINPWIKKVVDYDQSHQKFEWNCKGEERNLWNNIIQFRASGVRVKRPTMSPSLVAMNSTMVPVIAWEKRYITPRECSRLQSMDGLTVLPEPDARAYKALGNAVNAKIVKIIAQSLLPRKNKNKSEAA